MTIRRALPALLAAVLACGGLAACGEREEPTGAGQREQLDLVLDYFPNADHAGIYNAIDGGQFRQANLDVDPRTPSDPSAPLKLLTPARRTSRSPMSPSCCSRATRAPSSCRSARSCRRR